MEIISTHVSSCMMLTGPISSCSSAATSAFICFMSALNCTWSKIWSFVQVSWCHWALYIATLLSCMCTCVKLLTVHVFMPLFCCWSRTHRLVSLLRCLEDISSWTAAHQWKLKPRKLTCSTSQQSRVSEICSLQTPTACGLGRTWACDICSVNAKCKMQPSQQATKNVS